jgi:hypothetical protein
MAVSQAMELLHKSLMLCNFFKAQDSTKQVPYEISYDL